MIYFTIFFDFLRFCIGATEGIPESVKNAEVVWEGDGLAMLECSESSEWIRGDCPPATLLRRVESRFSDMQPTGIGG